MLQVIFLFLYHSDVVCLTSRIALDEKKCDNSEGLPKYLCIDIQTDREFKKNTLSIWRIFFIKAFLSILQM